MYKLLTIVFNVVLYAVPIGLMWLFVAHGFPMYHLDLNDYLTILRWGHL